MFTGPNIVEEGLVLALDAANIKSFRGEPTTNILSSYVNPTFENGTTSGDGWSFDAKTDGTREYYSADTYAGAYSMKLTNSTVSSIAFWKSNIPVVSGVSYNMSVFAKNIDCPTTPYFSGVNISLAGGENNSFTGINSEWQRFTATYTATATGNAQFYIRTGANASQGSFLIDDFQIEEKPYPTRFVNGTRGTTVATGGGWADLSGNDYHGEILNGTTTDPNNLTVLEFDGTDDYINLGDLDVINGAFSVDIWFRGNPTQTGTYAALVSKDAAGSFGNFNMGGNSSNDYVRFGFSGSGGQKEVSYAGVYDLKADAWVHYIGTWDGSSTLKLYRNSVLVDTNTSATGTLVANNNDLLIGDRTATDGFFGGKIASVKIYNKVLTASEVLNNFNATKGRFGL